MTSERQRVSDATLLRYIKTNELGWLDPLLLDLRDAREENACLVEQILSRKPEAVEADLQRVMAENVNLRAALATAIRVAGEAQREWDRAPEGMKAGKLLIALCDRSFHYRGDISAMHRALAPDTAEGE